ncbi:MAG: diadenylate cyclase [Bacteroidia bacterium]|jgi:diadenylate cyclase|nr:diadenylate cyclase [Bacteroidia bacterium]
MEIFKIYSYKFTLIHLIDIVMLGFVIYQLYRILKGSLAFNMMAGLLTIYVAWLVVRFFQMPLMETVLGEFTKVGIIAILIVFQQEIRKFLLLIGRSALTGENQSIFRFLPWNWKVEKNFNTNYEEIVEACELLANSYTGALIVFPKTSEMKFIGASGEILDSFITKKIILSIFNKTSPLHDGAMIIANSRIKAVNAVLPVSDNPEYQSKYGLRHLSALGITEQTDAIALVVSEERGTMAIAKGGKLTDNLSKQELVEMLTTEFSSQMLSVNTQPNK